MDRLDLQAVIVYVGVYSKTICTRAQGMYTWRVGVAELHAFRNKWGRGCNVKVRFPECPLFGGKNTFQKCFGTKDSVRCSEFGGGRFSEVANVLQAWDFQSMTRALSALGSVSASRSVRSGRFCCISVFYASAKAGVWFLLTIADLLIFSLKLIKCSRDLWPLLTRERRPERAWTG